MTRNISNAFAIIKTKSSPGDIGAATISDRVWFVASPSLAAVEASGLTGWVGDVSLAAFEVSESKMRSRDIWLSGDVSLHALLVEGGVFSSPWSGDVSLDGLAADGLLGWTGSASLQPIRSTGSFYPIPTLSGSPVLYGLQAEGALSHKYWSGSPSLASVAAAGTLTMTDRMWGSPQLAPLKAHGYLGAAISYSGDVTLRALTAYGELDLVTVFDDTILRHSRGGRR